MPVTRTWLGCYIAFIISLLPLLVLAQSAPPATATPRIALYGPLVYGDYVRGSVNEDVPAAIYAFVGQAGDRVTITLTSDDFDAYLALRDADQNVLVTAEASAGESNARIEGYILPADGTYIIRAGAFGGGVKGAYELRLERSPPVHRCHHRAHHGH